MAVVNIEQNMATYGVDVNAKDRFFKERSKKSELHDICRKLAHAITKYLRRQVFCKFLATPIFCSFLSKNGL